VPSLFFVHAFALADAASGKVTFHLQVVSEEVIGGIATYDNANCNFFTTTRDTTCML